MNRAIRTSYLLTLLFVYTTTNTISALPNNMHLLPISWCKKTASFLKNTAITTATLAAATAATGAICYYLLLPAATQTASSIGTAVIHETARVAEVAVEKTAPFGAGGFLVHYLMNEFGIQSHQGMGRAYAASLALYLVRRQMLMTLGI